MTDRDELRCAEGTSRCPICGMDTPHKHSAQEVREWRESEAWVQKSWEHFQGEYADKFRAAEMAGALRRAEQWLRSISEWLLTTDNDMRLPDGILDTDPLDLADMLAALDIPAVQREARRDGLGLMREWMREAWPKVSDSDFNQGVVRGFEIIDAQIEHGHIANWMDARALSEGTEHDPE